MDKKLLFLTILLFGFGLVMIYSASNVTAYMNDASPGRYFMKQLIFLVVGVVASGFLIRFKTKTYSVASWIGTLAIGVIILCLAIYGTAVKGAYGWIGYKGLGIQPSEFAKILIIPLLATYYEKNVSENDNIKKMYFPMILVGLITFFIILQQDYGTALIFLIIGVCMFFLAPVSDRIKKITGVLGIIVVLVFALLVVIFQDKIIPADKLSRFDFRNPCERYTTSGNQLCNSYIAINSGGIAGKGLGNSTQKYLYLPEAHTDFIFAIIVEELGLIGGIFLLILYILLLMAIVRSGKKSYRISHYLICYGVTIYLFLHIIINLGGVLGIIPITGVPLPFMSYGGSFCWCSLFALTMVQRVNYETNTRKIKKMKKYAK